MAARPESISAESLVPGVTASPRGRPRFAARGLVPRTDIVKRCVDAIDASVVLLSAPAGYGKTTILSQWEGDDPRLFAWLALDDRDNDPHLLVGSIAAALARIEPVDEGVFAPLRSANLQLSGVVVPRLCDALRERERPFVLVFDDLQHLHNPESLGVIAAMSENVPLGSTLAIASRDEPAIPLGRLRARRLLLELNAEDLAMTRSEASDLLLEAGLTLPADDVQRLVDHTEGWPVGLYLTSLSLNEEAEASPEIESSFGDHRLVTDYLRDEFLSDRPAAEVDFLVRTSILDRLSGPICDGVLGCEGSAETLLRLSRSNLLVIPLDGRDLEYRYHALLREMLAAELHRDGEEHEAELHARASRWCADHGDIDGAVEHAIAAGDREAAGTLIWSVTATFASGGRHATLRRWLDCFTEEQIAASPQLAVSLAASETTLGRGTQAERWVRSALEALKLHPRADGPILEAAGQMIVAAGAARDGVGPMGELVSPVFAVLPEDSPWRSMCCLLAGVSHHLRNDPEGARELLEEGSRRADHVAPNIQLICLAQLALLAMGDKEHDDAAALSARAIDEASHFGLDDQPTLALVHAVAALIDAHRGAAEDALKRVRLAADHLDRLDVSPWYEAEAHIVLARALLLLDDVAGARAQLTQSARYLRHVADATLLRDWLQQAWEDADAATTTGRWPLSPAELRLLHVLPTHLSFPEIGEQFFVSPNTVKTQAQAIYRKLGVSSRAEAVQCARGAGLLADDGAGPARNGT